MGCHVKKKEKKKKKEKGCYLTGQGHSEGLCNQNMTVFTISSELMLLLQPKLRFI